MRVTLGTVEHIAEALSTPRGGEESRRLAAPPGILSALGASLDAFPLSLGLPPAAFASVVVASAGDSPYSGCGVVE